MGRLSYPRSVALSSLVSALLFSVKSDDDAAYETKLKEMASRHISEYTAGDTDTTYRRGVDFMTNQPRFQLRRGEATDNRQLRITLHLLGSTQTAPMEKGYEIA